MTATFEPNFYGTVDLMLRQRRHQEAATALTLACRNEACRVNLIRTGATEQTPALAQATRLVASFKWDYLQARGAK